MADLDLIGTPPHCDQAILHAPGECEFCDMHPDWQELRKLWGIAFTGHKPETGIWAEVPCPSDARRPGGLNQEWYGNKPDTQFQNLSRSALRSGVSKSPEPVTIRAWINKVGPVKPVTLNDYGETPELPLRLTVNDPDGAAKLLELFMSQSGGFPVTLTVEEDLS